MKKSLYFLRFVLVAVAITGAAAGIAAAEEIPAGFTHVKTEREISEYRLDANGLRVLLLPDRSAPAATMMVTYHVGSRNESYGTTGATHLLEHLMFKGTRTYNREAGNRFDQLMERTGATTNATTWLDRTNYFETVGSQDLPLAIALEADRMRNLLLREEDRRPEMTVVRNEFERGENDPAQALDKEIWAAAYQAHPYHHSTIGWRSDIERVPIEKLRAFYDTYYWPNNATVTIIGDFEPTAALELIKQHYGAIPRSPNPIPEVYTEEPPQTGPRRVTMQRPGELGVVMIAQKMPSATHPDYAALEVLGLILSDGRNSRLYKALTDKSLTTDVSAGPQFNRDPSLYFISAELTPDGKHADVEERILQEIARVQEAGVEADEVAAAIAKFTASTAFRRDGSTAMAFAINECIAVTDWTLFYRLEDAVKQVTAADVQRVAKQYFAEDQRTTGWYIPRNDKPADPSGAAAGAVARVDSPAVAQRVEPENAGKATPASTDNSQKLLPSRVPARGSQTSAAAPPAAKIAPRIMRTRSANIDLLVCPTQVKDVVMITGALPAYDPANPILGELTAEMLERGTTLHDADTIAALLDKVGAQISFSYDSGSVTFSARCLRKDSQQVIGLLAEQLSKPSFDKDEFEKLRKQKLAQAQQMREDTSAQASIAFRRAVYQAGHPQYRLTVEERMATLQKVGVAEISAFHAKNLGPDHCTMVIVGDVEPGAVQASVASAFADWKGGRALPAIPSARMIQERADLTAIVPGKQSVNVILGVPTGLRYADTDYLPLEVATNVLGRGFTSRLVGAVRDTEGLTYGIAAGLAGSGKLDHAWAVNATFAPSLLAQGLTSTRRELAKWHRDGITADELEYRKSSLAGAHRVSMATSRGLAQMILNTVRRGLELTWIDEYPGKVASLTLEQVNSTIKKYVDPDRLVTVRAGTLGE